MFGKNKIFQPKSYVDQPADTLLITSIFYTLQGEGPFSGQPAVFVRLTGCNLQCSFCDTYFDSGDTLTYQEIEEKIKNSIHKFYADNYLNYVIDKKPLVVVTGGEPLIQPNLTGFLKYLTQQGWCTQIESNGIIHREIPDETHLIISPKVNERINKYIMPHVKNLDRADSLKFVISADMEGYKDIPQFALDAYNTKTFLRKKALYVSPMNEYNTQPVKLGADGTLEARSEVDERISFWTPGLLDMKRNQANHEYAAFIAMKHGATLSLQTHLLASLP